MSNALKRDWRLNERPSTIVEWVKETPTHVFTVTLINNDADAYYRVSVACVDADGDPLIGEYVTGRYDNRETALRHAALLADIVGWRR